MAAPSKRRRDDDAVDDAGFPAPAPLSRPRTDAAAGAGKGKGKAPLSALEALRSSQDDGPVVRYQPEGDEDSEGAGSSAAGPSTREQVLEALDTMDSIDVPTLDVTTLKRMVLKLERTISKNQQMRIKYSDEPDKFMESEMDLDEDLKRMQMLATAPQLYRDFVALNAVQSLVGLLGHENVDIAIDVVDLFKEMTDSDNTPEDDPGVIVDALLEHQGLEMFVQNLKRLNENETEESQGVYDTLAVFENLLEIRPEIGDAIVKANFLDWALPRLKQRAFDQNKQYTSELLAILLQNSTPNRLALGEANGLDVLLQAIAVYKRKDPASADEVELLENLFDCLCSALLEGENRPRFLQSEGVELMVILIKEKKLARAGALKTMSYAMAGVDGAAVSNRFVEALGLPAYFPALMGKSAGKLKKTYKDYDEDAEEEHAISIVSSMFQHLRGMNRNRLLNKFLENELEKVDRLLELHFKYAARVSAGDRRLEQRRQELLAQGEEIDEEELEEEFYLTRLENGLFRLQQVDLALAYLCVSGLEDVRAHCQRMLHLKGSSFEDLGKTLDEYAKTVGEAAPEPIRERQRAEVRDLMRKLLNPEEAAPAAAEAADTAEAAPEAPAADAAAGAEDNRMDEA